MSLRQVLTHPHPHKKRTWFDWASEAMEKDDYDYFLECLQNPVFSNRYLSIKLTEAGYKVSETTIAHLRRSTVWETLKTI